MNINHKKLFGSNVIPDLKAAAQRRFNLFQYLKAVYNKKFLIIQTFKIERYIMTIHI